MGELTPPLGATPKSSLREDPPLGSVQLPQNPPSAVKSLVAAAFFALSTAGCGTAEYLAQAGCGQVDLLSRARDISEVEKDERVPKRVRDLLGQVDSIKRFGEENHLKPTKNYHRYVELDRSVVVWVVTASAPLKFQSKTWWFPIVGRVPYLGWFKAQDAHALADELRGEGWDADVGGAEAYSTLGWFDDPILSTMLPEGSRAIGGLVDVVLHESVHATLYIDEQTPFNESLANFVAGRLTTKYLREKYGEGSPEARAFEDAEERGKRRAAAMHTAYGKLEALYASALPREEKLAQKAKIMTALGAQIHAARPLNNASLASFKHYNSGKPELVALLDACEGSFDRFLSSVSRLKAKGSFPKKNDYDLKRALDPLISAGCPPG